MEKYKVVTIGNVFTDKFYSNSRNAIQHLRNHGGVRCIVYDNKTGLPVSGAEYSEEFGYYHITVK